MQKLTQAQARETQGGIVPLLIMGGLALVNAVAWGSVIRSLRK